MDKFLKAIQWVLGAIVNIILLAGALIIVLWLGWGIKPQTSITKTAYFLSESWALVTGEKASDRTPLVRKEQLEESAARTTRLKAR